MQFDNFTLKLNASDFASRSKDKAKPRRRTLVSLPIGERKSSDVKPEDCSPVEYTVSKQQSTLFRHGQLPRGDDGALEIWRVQEHLRNDLERSSLLSDEKWKGTMGKGGGNKK